MSKTQDSELLDQWLGHPVTAHVVAGLEVEKAAALAVLIGRARGTTDAQVARACAQYDILNATILTMTEKEIPDAPEPDESESDDEE